MSSPTQEELPLNLPLPFYHGGLPYTPPKERGYLYIMRCESHRKNQRKLGVASRDPEYYRRKQLGGTSNPDPFIVEYDAFVFDASEIENLLHVKLARYRHRSNREFFVVPLQTAIDAIKEVAGTNLIIDKFGETNKFAVLPPAFPKPPPYNPPSSPNLPKLKAFQAPSPPPVFPRHEPHNPIPPPVFPKASSK